MTSNRQSDSSVVLPQGFAEGTVIHHRMHPKRHRFKYRMSWCVLDVDDLTFWTGASRCWQHNRWGLLAIKDQDYLNQQAEPIGDKVRAYLQQQTGSAFTGQIRLFTHPRFLGYGFNSVNFYFCYQHQQLSYIISEINNTPWGKKHLYFHDCRQAGVADHQWEFRFELSIFHPL